MERLRGPMQRFAMSLFQACRKEYPKGNILFSPFTASTGFLLIFMGADGMTKAELEDALQLEEILGSKQSSNGENDLEMAFRHALAVLSKLAPTADPVQTLSTPVADYGAFKVFRINKLFLEEGIPVRDEFVQRLTKMQAEISYVSFQRNPEAARTQMNEYVREAINGKVADCFASSSIMRGTSMVLANGICFRARWNVVFDPSLTVTLPFRQENGNVVDFRMMRGVFNLPYACDRDIGLTFIEIPYVFNSASLLIFLPHGKQTLGDAGKILNPVTMNQLNLVKRLREIDLTLPKFKLRTNLDMKAIISKLGVKSVFSEQADMSRMSPEEHVCLSAARHIGFFSVDEIGTDATESVQQQVDGQRKNLVTSLNDGDAQSKSGTAGSLKARVSGREPSAKAIPVVVDRPFFFGVRHNKSGIMISLGRMLTIE